jgi:hypothetical protein
VPIALISMALMVFAVLLLLSSFETSRSFDDIGNDTASISAASIGFKAGESESNESRERKELHLVFELYSLQSTQYLNAKNRSFRYGN